MQDRFKFRFWHKPTEKMIDCYGYNKDFVFGDVLDGIGTTYNPAKFDDCILMQCTGLKDKNGKLIYEGDIINIWCKNLTKNQISEVKFCKERAAFTFDYFTDYGNIVPCTMEKTEIEVIGNIYENPELELLED